MGRYKIGIGCLAGVAVLLSILLASKQEALPEYHEQKETEPAIEQALPEMYDYYTGLYGISVPSGWKEVNRDGLTCFVDPATASVIEIGYEPYYPQINMMNGSTATCNLTENGFTMSDFVRTGSDSYNCTYAKDGIAYLEYVFWDFDNVYSVVGKYTAENYSEVYDVIIASLESFRHFGEAIPAGWRVLYYEYGNFSVLAKEDWGYSESSDAITFSDPSTGLNISVNVSPSDEDFSGLDQLTFTQNAAAGKNDYIQSAFTNTGREIYATAIYTLNGRYFCEHFYGIARNGYWYMNTSVYPSEREGYTDVQTFFDNFVTW